jgi:hypothetical protein
MSQWQARVWEADTMANKSRAADRTWQGSASLTLMIVAVATAASALINPLIGRSVHWDIVAVLMPTLFVLFTVLLRKRWV